MLSQHVIDRIRQLLAEKALSQRRIALLLGVSRATVARVASGRRRDREPRPPDEDGALASRGPLDRCPQCGGWVHLPCQLCLARRHVVRRKLHQLRRVESCPEEPIRLELCDEHLHRYQAIHARRVRDGEWHATGGQPVGEADGAEDETSRACPPPPPLSRPRERGRG